MMYNEKLQFVNIRSDPRIQTTSQALELIAKKKIHTLAYPLTKAKVTPSVILVTLRLRLLIVIDVCFLIF